MPVIANNGGCAFLVQLPLFFLSREPNFRERGSDRFQDIPAGSEIWGVCQHVSVWNVPKGMDQAIAAWKGLSGLYAEVELGNIGGCVILAQLPIFFSRDFLSDGIIQGEAKKRKEGPDHFSRQIAISWQEGKAHRAGF